MRIKFITILIAFCVVSAGTAFGNGLSLNNVGIKALGMGGAYIGVADDYSATYWNPAGLTQIKGAQIGLFTMDIMPTATYKYDAAGIDAQTDAMHYIGPSLMGYMPVLEGDLALGLGIYLPSGLGAKWNGDDLTALSGGPGAATPGKSFEWETRLGAYHFAPSVAYKINDMFSVGAALNVSYAFLEIKQPRDLLMQDSSGAIVPGQDRAVDSQYEEDGSGIGFGGTIGVMIKPHDKVNIGLTFRTENTVAMTGTAKLDAFKAYGKEETDYERDLSWPMWFGGGIAVELMEDLIVALDLQYSQWSATQDEIATTYDKWGELMTPEQAAIVLHWEDAMQIRFGIQYGVNEDLTLRAGYYNDPAPAPDETLNILFPSITNNAFTLGGSYNFGQFGVDVGLEYLMGEDRAVTASGHNMPGTHGMNMFVWALGINYFFGK